MDNYDHIDILSEYKKLLALTKSYEGRLDEYARIARVRDEEIVMLQQMLTDATSYRSSVDSQVNELKELQKNIGKLKKQADSSSYTDTNQYQQAGEPVSARQQLENLQLQYAHLQTQLADLQTQYLELHNRNLLLQQHSTRIAELESLLSNAEEEISQLKKQDSQSPKDNL